jgi:methionyl-tRNA formyltransferase
MRIVFCGSGSFAIPSLRAVLDSDHEIVAVFTQPPRRAGRGGQMRNTPVAEAARELGLTTIETPNINDEEFVSAVASARPEAICVVDFGQMVRARVREQASGDSFNLHGSLLPELRGAAPVNWALIRGYRRTGVTTFSLVDKLDAGPIYVQEELQILPGERGDSLRGRLADLGASVVCQTLGLIAAGWAQPVAQDETKATLAPRLSKADGRIDWSAPAETIRDLVHGAWPWPGGQTVFRRQNGKSGPATLASVRAEPSGAPGAPGSLDADGFIRAGEGRIAIEEIKPAGKRLMSWRDFVNGYRVSEGDCFIGCEADA